MLQLAAIVFLPLLGAIVLTLRKREGVRHQNIGEQVSRPREASIEIKNIPSGSGI